MADKYKNLIFDEHIFFLKFNNRPHTRQEAPDTHGHEQVTLFILTMIRTIDYRRHEVSVFIY